MRWARGALLAAIFAAGWGLASLYWTTAYAPLGARADVLAKEAERIRAEVARVRELCTRRAL